MSLPGEMRGDTPAARAMSVLAQAVLAGLLYGEREARPLAEIPPDKADMLRPMAETLAMIDGNAFFGHRYADANNAGEGGGWAGLASFARRD